LLKAQTQQLQELDETRDRLIVLQTRYRELQALCLSKDAELSDMQQLIPDTDLAMSLRDCQAVLEATRNHLRQVLSERDRLLDMSNEIRAQLKDLQAGPDRAPLSPIQPNNVPADYHDPTRNDSSARRHATSAKEAKQKLQQLTRSSKSKLPVRNWNVKDD